MTSLVRDMIIPAFVLSLVAVLILDAHLSVKGSTHEHQAQVLSRGNQVPQDDDQKVGVHGAFVNLYAESECRQIHACSGSKKKLEHTEVNKVTQGSNKSHEELVQNRPNHAF